jgi:dephospho-CoA kinase
MNERVIVQIVGEAGAGKSDVCAHLAREYDFSVILVSDIIRSFARSRNITLGPRSDYLKAHTQMKEEQGMDIVARTILETPISRLCIDGIRVLNDVGRLQTATDVESKIIALHCPTEIRFERSLQRGSSLDGLTFEEFLQDDLQDAYNSDPERQNTLAVMSAADYHVDASQSQALVFKAIDEIIIPILHG